MAPFFKGVIGFFAAGLGGYFALKGFLPKEVAGVLGYALGLAAFFTGIGSVSSMLQWFHGEHSEHSTGDWTRFFRFTLDHKVIGIQYAVTSMVILVVAGTMAMIMRAELARPGIQFLGAKAYNSVMTMHGIGMVVVALTAIVGGIGNYVVPLTIGARDMAFPRLNALSFWIVPPAVFLLLGALALGGMDTGWTAYPPLSTEGGIGKLLFLLAFITVGFSSIFGGLNTFTTIWTLRAKGMTFLRMPIFAWSMLAASTIMVMATSVVAGSLIMIVCDRAIGTSFFDARRGGSALLYQHLFWFYSHPAVYIMILPAFGVSLEILPVFSRKPLFAYALTAAAFFGVVALSFVVWAHHIFTSGMWDLLSIPFMVLTEMISIPTGVVFLAALGTLWAGKLRLKTPMLFAIGFLFQFLVGGLTGIFLADAPTDLHLHDTLFVVAHFHFTIVGGVIFSFFAGAYYWFPKVTGRMYGETLGKVHFWIWTAGFNAIFFPLFWLGTRGVPRRTVDYPPEFGGVQAWVTVAGWVAGASVLVFFFNMIRSAMKGERAGDNPWGAQTLEWTTTSPPPLENYEKDPEVAAPPYEFGTVPSR